MIPVKKALMIFLLAVAMPVLAEDEAIATLFHQNGIIGTIVVSALKGNRQYIHNDILAFTRGPEDWHCS